MALLIAALLTAMFGISDWNLVGHAPEFYFLIAIRSVMVAGCLLLAALISTSPAPLTRPWLYSVAPILIATGMMLFTAYRPETIATQLTATVVVVMSFYVFVPNFLRGMIGSSLYLTAGFLVGAWHWGSLDPIPVLVMTLLLVMANIVGYIVALRLARMQREQFFLEAKLRQMADTDDLTGLANRRHFMERALTALADTRRQCLPFSICMIDIDRFKTINDTFGHGGGDRVLQKVARTCLATFDGEEPLARFGGEEFVVALPGADLEQARRTAEQLRQKVAALQFDDELAGHQVTVTIGVAQVRPRESGLEQALGRADAALYLGKRNGRDTVIAEMEGHLAYQPEPLMPAGRRDKSVA